MPSNLIFSSAWVDVHASNRSLTIGSNLFDGGESIDVSFTRASFDKDIYEHIRWQVIKNVKQPESFEFLKFFKSSIKSTASLQIYLSFGVTNNLASLTKMSQDNLDQLQQHVRAILVSYQTQAFAVERYYEHRIKLLHDQKAAIQNKLKQCCKNKIATFINISKQTNDKKKAMSIREAKSFGSSLLVKHNTKNTTDSNAITIIDKNNYNNNVTNLNNGTKHTQRLNKRSGIACNDNNYKTGRITICTPIKLESLSNSNERNLDMEQDNCAVAAASISVCPKLEIDDTISNCQHDSDFNGENSRNNDNCLQDQQCKVTNILISDIANENCDNTNIEAPSTLKRDNMNIKKRNDDMPALIHNNNNQMVKNNSSTKQIETENYKKLMQKIDGKITRIRKYGWKCHDCGGIFKTKRQVQSHVGAKHFEYQERPFKCSECDKRYLFPCLLNQHKNIHTSKYRCDICGKNWESRHLLQVHKRRMHTGERPCQCRICKRKFHQHSDLNSHEKSHRKDKN